MGDPLELFDPAVLLGAEELRASVVLRTLAEGSKDDMEGAAAEPEVKTYSDCRYLSCKALGLSVRLSPAGDNGRVDVVFLYNEGVDGFSAYRGPLPQSLQWADVSRDVVARLGEPSDKYGGGRVPVA